LRVGLRAIGRNEMPQFCLHFGSNFSPHPDVQDKPRITRRQTAKFRWWQVLISEKPFDKARDMHDVSSMIDPD
jgi:hypothetical protein